MLWRNRRDAALLARVIEKSKCLFGLRHESNKSEKGEKMKKLRKEEKRLFGKLIETKRDKVKRVKLESQGKIEKTAPSNVNSEFPWMMTSSNKLKIIKVPPIFDEYSLDEPQINSNGKKSTDDSEFSWTMATSKRWTVIKKPKTPVEHNLSPTNSKSNCDTQEVRNIEENKEQCTLTRDTKIQDTSNVEPKASESKNPLLPRPLVQHLLDFPIFEPHKSTADEWSDKSSIMSLSQMDNKPCLKYPSVTRILSATMSEEAKAILEKWKMRKIEELGPRGFELYQAGIYTYHELQISYLHFVFILTFCFRIAVGWKVVSRDSHVQFD